MAGRDRRARRKAIFPNQFVFDPRSERRRQIRVGEGRRCQHARRVRSRVHQSFLSFVFAKAKIALHS